MDALVDDTVADSTSDSIATDHLLAVPCSPSPPSIVVPAAYKNPATSVSAWAAWYGNQAAVSSVAERLMKLRVQELAPVRSRMKQARHPASALLAFLGIEEHRGPVAREMGDDFSRVDMPSRLDVNLGLLIGVDVRDRIKRVVESAPSNDLAESVVSDFPLLRSVYQAGAFYRATTLPLLYLGALKRHCQSTSFKPSMVERFRLDMAITLLVREVSPALSALLFSGCTYFESVFPGVAEVPGVVHSLQDLDESLPLHEQLSSSDFALLVEYVQSSSVTELATAIPGYIRLLDQIESACISQKRGQSALDIAYQQFVNDFARGEWENLHSALASHAESVEAVFDLKSFPRSLVGRPLVAPKGAMDAATALLRSLISACNGKLDAAAFIARADKKFMKARDLQLQLSALGGNLTASALTKIVSLAETTRAELLANKGWLSDELNGYRPLVSAWERFYSEWERLERRAPATSNSTKQAKPLSVVERLPEQSAAPESQNSEIASLQERLETAQADCTHREQECSELRREIHGLRLYRDSVSHSEASAAPPQIDLDILRRIGSRDSITPVDILTFIHAVAGSRVVILDSAWKSARESERFPHGPRLLDVIHTMVFPYYESIMSGKPDSVSRELLAGAYSAKESETVACIPKMRSQREFTYQNEVHFFERHLKVGNGGGIECMRVHFDILDGIIVIAYAGVHLECPSTN